MTGFELYQTITVRVPLPPDFAISYPVAADVGWCWSCERNVILDLNRNINTLHKMVDEASKLAGEFW